MRTSMLIISIVCANNRHRAIEDGDRRSEREI